MRMMMKRKGKRTGKMRRGSENEDEAVVLIQTSAS